MATTETQAPPEQSETPPSPGLPTHPPTDDGPKTGDIFALMSNVMAEVGAVGKNQTNDFHRYKYRGIDDLYDAVHPALVKYGIWCAPEVRETRIKYVQASTDGDKKAKTKVHAILTVAFTWYAGDGSHVTTVTLGEAMDSGDRACSKALTDAYKKALFQTLCIPVSDISFDPEKVGHDLDDDPEAPQLTDGTGRPVDPPPAPPSEPKGPDLRRLKALMKNHHLGRDKAENWLAHFSKVDGEKYTRLSELSQDHIDAICQKIEDWEASRKD